MSESTIFAIAFMTLAVFGVAGLEIYSRRQAKRRIEVKSVERSH